MTAAEQPHHGHEQGSPAPGTQAYKDLAEVSEDRFHADLPAATAWTYEGSFPGPTMDTDHDVEVTVDWENALADEHGHAAHALDRPRRPGRRLADP